MWDPGERFRSLEVVVARAVAESHLVDSMRCAIEAGRTGGTQEHAIAARCERFAYETIHPSLLPTVVSDIVKQMMRLDFFVLMQGLCRIFKTPAITVPELVKLLEVGEAPFEVGTWLNELGAAKKVGDTLDKRAGSLLLKHNFLVGTAALKVPISEYVASNLTVLDQVPFADSCGLSTTDI